jgi:hypothetical protein
MPDLPDLDLAKINGQFGNGFRIDGAAKNEDEGFSVAGGDAVGNKRQDALIGGTGANGFAGSTYLLDVILAA